MNVHAYIVSYKLTIVTCKHNITN